MYLNSLFYKLNISGTIVSCTLIISLISGGYVQQARVSREH